MRNYISILFACTILAIVSCKKDEVVPKPNDTQSVLDNIIADQSTEAIFNIVNDYGLNLLNDREVQIDSGVVVSISPLYPVDLYPKTMIINYGNGILCSDGVLRKGKIVAVFNNKWSLDSANNSADVEITLNGFYANNVQYIATIEVEMTNIIGSEVEFVLQTSNSKMIFSDGSNISWTTQRTIKWISGIQTLENNNDDIYLISCTTTGISRKGAGFESSTKEPLRFENSCLSGTFTQGVIEIIPQDQSKHTINFGDGSCDRNATLTVNGITIDFTF